MEKITSKKGMQKIVIAILIVLSFNFIVPNYSQADFGGMLLGPIIDFIAGIGDAVLAALQHFMYDGEQGGVLSTAGGAVGGVLTIFNPFDTFQVDVEDFTTEVAAEYDMEVTESDRENLTTVQVPESELDDGWFGLGTYQIPIIRYTPEKIFSNQVPALDVNFINPTDWGDEDMNNRSVTRALHSTVAGWYVALRNLAIIALLSVLLYVGIRMVISSTAADKAKYKQMLMDWVVALCIVFFLHYVMSFILTITSMVTEGISSSSEIIVQIPRDGEETLEFKTNLTGLTRIQLQYRDLGIRMIYLVFYIALVIYTLMFTWTYVKRAITMAFLTLMAPLVAITYPIDKISDGKAQAFNIWLREFVFNALLQPFHLIIYTVFLGGASQIAANNPIYAILFLAFIIPSEKLLRKMFGFDKSSTAGGMSTAASMLGGAAVLKGAGSLIGKIGKSKSGGSSAGKAGVRTKNPITDSNAPSKPKDLIDTFENNGGANSDEASRGSASNIRANSSGSSNISANSREASNRSLNNGTSATNSTIGNGSGYATESGIWLPDSPSRQTTNGSASGISLPNSPYSQTANNSARLSTSPLTSNQANRTAQQSQDNRSVWQRMKDDDSGRGLGGWIKEETKFGRKLTNGARSIRNIPNAIRRLPNTIVDKGPLKNLPKPIRNTIRGAIGTVGKAAVGTAKFAGKAALGGTLGLAAGIAGDDLEDVLKYGAAGAALGVTGLPLLGRGVSTAAGDLRDTYENYAFGSEEAALKQQARDLRADASWNEAMDKAYEDIYGAEPNAVQSREFKESGIEYYNAGITSTKEIKKSLKFEKELREQMLSNGQNEDIASANARKQAMVISKMASGIDEKELINEAKRNDRKEQIYKQLMDSGMDKKSASSSADYTMKLLMKRKGLSPD